MQSINNNYTIPYLLQIIGERYVKIEQGKGLVSAAEIDSLKAAVKSLEQKVEQLEAGGGFESYQGSYTVTPSSAEQILETANLLMENDVTIYEIPYFETSNNSGGDTVYIGSEITKE